jgi:hypothetical protein
MFQKFFLGDSIGSRLDSSKLMTGQPAYHRALITHTVQHLPLNRHGMRERAGFDGVFILRNNREVDITQGFCPETGFPLCCRVISEEKFRDLLSPNGYISGYLNLLRLIIYKDFNPLFPVPQPHLPEDQTKKITKEIIREISIYH